MFSEAQPYLAVFHKIRIKQKCQTLYKTDWEINEKAHLKLANVITKMPINLLSISKSTNRMNKE
jgi:hypothetical protein